MEEKQENPFSKKTIRTMKGDILRAQQETGKQKLGAAEVFELRAEKEKTRKQEEEKRRKIEEDIKLKEEERMKKEEEELLRERKTERLKELEKQKKKEAEKKRRAEEKIKEEREKHRPPVEQPKPVKTEDTKEILLEEKEKIKQERQELIKEFQELTKRKEPLEAEKLLLSKKINQIKKNFQSIISKEKKIEMAQEALEEKEAAAKTSRQKKRIEKQRWNIEEKRRELEKKRWPWDEKIKKLDDRTSEIEDEQGELEFKESELLNRQQKFTQKEEEIDLQLEKIKIDKELQKSKELEESFKADRDKLSKEISKIKLSLDAVLADEEKIEEKKKIIEQEERTAKELDRKRELEKERWSIEENRRRIEAKRWETEEKKQELENQIKRTDNRIQTILEKRNNTVARKEEINKKLGQQPVVKSVPKPAKVEEKPTPDLSESKDTDGQIRIEQARRRIALLRKAVEEKQPKIEPKPEKPAKAETPRPKKEIETAPLKETDIKEKRRKELLKRLSPLETEKEVGQIKPPKPPKPSSELIRVVPQKPSFREKLWLRILILTIVLIILTGVVTFWYWFFKVRNQTPVLEEEEKVEEAPQEVIIPDSLFSVDNIKLIPISNLEEVADLLFETLQQDEPEGQFKRVIIKTNTKVITLKEFFQSLLIEPPEDFYSKIEQDSTLFIYSQTQGNRLGFVVKVIDKQGLEDLLTLQETTMEYDFNTFFELQGKEEPAIVPYFREGPNFRYQTLNTNDLGICYFVSDDYFVFTSSWNSMEKVLEKLEI